MNTKHKKLIYLAGPITSVSPDMYLERIKAHAKCAVSIQEQGEVNVYSPASETHGLVELGGKVGTTWDDWRGHDLNLLSRCDGLYVMMLEGWKESKGVRGEVKYALMNNIPVEFVAPDGSYSVVTKVLDMFDVKEVCELND